MDHFFQNYHDFNGCFKFWRRDVKKELSCLCWWCAISLTKTFFHIDRFIREQCTWVSLDLEVLSGIACSQMMRGYWIVYALKLATCPELTKTSVTNSLWENILTRMVSRDALVSKVHFVNLRILLFVYDTDYIFLLFWLCGCFHV